MITKSLCLALPLTLSILLSGCGSSGGSSESGETTSTTPKIYNATFNAKSSGVTYECGSQTGSLLDDGTFKFEEGKECTFYDGANVIQKVIPSNLKQGAAIDETENNAGTKSNNEVTQETTATSRLAKLLRGKTYYSVQPKDSRIIILEFESEMVDGKFYVWASLDGASLNTSYKIVDKILTIPSRNLTFQFIEEKADYLLFDSERRMYKDKTKAEAFATANK